MLQDSFKVLQDVIQARHDASKTLPRGSRMLLRRVDTFGKLFMSPTENALRATLLFKRCMGRNQRFAGPQDASKTLRDAFKTPPEAPLDASETLRRSALQAGVACKPSFFIGLS